MATVAEQIAAKAAEAIRGRDAVLAAELERDDDRMDALHRRLWATLLGDWHDGTESAIDAVLLGRFYERYADHAVNGASTSPRALICPCTGATSCAGFRIGSITDPIRPSAGRPQRKFSIAQ